jgi:hypothetical protein
LKIPPGEVAVTLKDHVPAIEGVPLMEPVLGFNVRKGGSVPRSV